MANDTTGMPAAVDYPVDDRRRRPRGTPRRSHPRFTVVWTGRIVAPPRTLDCVILNISAAGAKLRVFEALDLPVRFTLIVDKFGDFPAELVWRDGRSAGVKFIGDPAQIGQTFASVLPVSRLFSRDS
ncbi:MAG: PilZ domain-containing protein [Alphaproteobacteria bacterium]|nr:PilZ domain-containing protein [Alphaproteobacteria bacterium]